MGVAALRRLDTAPCLGSAPRRSALRKNRRLARAEVIMAADATKEIQFEIGHVLFIDIVGYSKLLINEQSEQIQTLRKIVRNAEQFRLAEAEGKLRSEEHTSELQSRGHLVCRLLL